MKIYIYKIHIIFLILIVWITAISISATEKVYSTRDGLSTNQPQQIIELPDGQLFVETTDMFNLFDGMSFYQQEFDLEKTIEMQGFGGCNHWTDPSGLIWIKDWYRLFLYDPVRKHFLYDISQRITPSGVDIHQVQTFCIDTDQKAWLFCNDGRLLHYDWKHKGEEAIRISPNELKQGIHVTSVLKANKTLYLIFLNNGKLLHWDSTSHKILFTDTTFLTNGKPISDHCVFAIMQKDKRAALICQNNSNGGLYTYNLQQRKWQQLLHARVSSMERTANGQILLATSNGLCLFSDKDIDQMKEEQGDKEESHYIYSENNFAFAHQDRYGGIWAGTFPKGIIYYSSKQKDIYPVEGSHELGITSLAITSNHILIGTSHSLYDYDSKKGNLTNISNLGTKYNCMDMTPQSDGSIIVGTGQGLLSMSLNPSTGMWSGTINNYDGQQHSRYRFCLPLDDKKRWLACNLNNILGYVVPEEGKFKVLNNKISHLNNYRALRGAISLNKTEILVYSHNGIFILDTKKDEIRPFNPVLPYLKYSNKFNCAFLDKERRLWLGTQNGLVMVNLTDSTSLRLTTTNGLSNSCMQNIIADHEGRIWVGTAHGMNRLTLTKNDTIITQFGLSEGLPDTEMVERAVVINENGILYFATADGLYAIDTTKKTTASAPLAVVLTKFLAADQMQPLDAGPISLNHDENYICLNFSALNYSNESQTRYRYRLKGLDNEWRISSDGNGCVQVIYNSLPPGSYEFEVQAAEGDGAWGEMYTKSITVLPPWWASWWAKTLYLLLSVAAVIFIMRQYLKKKREMIARDNEKKVHQLFELREEARHQFAEAVKIDPNKIGIDEEETHLVEQMVECINSNMDNPDYNVVMLARDVAMSRSGLYAKLSNMLGITPSDFIRNVRLKYAAELLTDTDLPISEISLKAGYNSQRTFSTNFKKMFGTIPSEYRGKEGNTPS
jgi:AraC-like DNA-binding protein/ligand-binding sensor domain-containing protein